MGDGGVLFGRNGWADSAGVYTVSRRSLEERGEVIQDHCARHVSMYWCVGADWGRGLKSMGFWMSVANVGGIFGVKEDEQVGMSWKLGWNFCSNETTGYQARKEMACITVGDWRLRLIQLRNRFERIIFFRIWIRVSQLFPPQDGVSAAKLLKEAWVAGGEHPTARSVAWPSSPRCRLNSGRRGRTSRFFIFERLSNSNWSDRRIVWWGDRKVFGNYRSWRQFDAILFLDLVDVYVLVMFLLERRSTTGWSGGSLQVVKPCGFTAWSVTSKGGHRTGA